MVYRGFGLKALSLSILLLVAVVPLIGVMLENSRSSVLLAGNSSGEKDGVALDAGYKFSSYSSPYAMPGRLMPNSSYKPTYRPLFCTPLVPRVFGGSQNLSSTPTASDLGESSGVVFSSLVKGLASRLGGNLYDITRWVRENIAYEPYYGLMKGSHYTLVDLSGNDADQAALLVALLRLKGVPARFVLGTISVDPLVVEKWLSASSAEEAVAVLRANGVPAELSGNRVVMEHFWVKAYVNGTWIDLDPSFKTYNVSYPALFSKTSRLLEERAGIEDILLSNINDTSSVNVTKIYEAVEKILNESKLQLLVSGWQPFLDYLSAEWRKELVENETLSYDVVAVIGEYSSIPPEYAYRVSVSLEGTGLYYESVVADIVPISSFSIVFIPESLEDRVSINASEGVIPANISMVPILFRGLIPEKAGLESLEAGSQARLVVSFVEPCGVVDNVTRNITVGSRLLVYINTLANYYSYTRHVSRYIANLSSILTIQPYMVTPFNYLPFYIRSLSSVSMTLLLATIELKTLSQTTRTQYVLRPWAILFSDYMELQENNTLAQNGYYIDYLRVIINPYRLENNNFSLPLFVSAAARRIVESEKAGIALTIPRRGNETWQDLVNKTISVQDLIVRILREDPRSIVVLSENNMSLVETLDIPIKAKEFIRGPLREGYYVVAANKTLSLGSYNYTVFIVYDNTTGATSFHGILGGDITFQEAYGAYQRYSYDYSVIKDYLGAAVSAMRNVVLDYALEIMRHPEWYVNTWQQMAHLEDVAEVLARLDRVSDFLERLNTVDDFIKFISYLDTGKQVMDYLAQGDYTMAATLVVSTIVKEAATTYLQSLGPVGEVLAVSADLAANWLSKKMEEYYNNLNTIQQAQADMLYSTVIHRKNQLEVAKIRMIKKFLEFYEQIKLVDEGVIDITDITITPEDFYEAGIAFLESRKQFYLNDVQQVYEAGLMPYDGEEAFSRDLEELYTLYYSLTGAYNDLVMQYSNPPPGFDHPDDSYDISAPLYAPPQPLEKKRLAELREKLILALYKNLTSAALYYKALYSYVVFSEGYGEEEDIGKLIHYLRSFYESLDLLRERHMNVTYEVDLTPSIALLTLGYWRGMEKILGTIGLPYKIITPYTDINSSSFIKYYPVLVLPSGALDEIESEEYLEKLREYVELGGTIISLSEARDESFSKLPGNVEGIGWINDISCWWRSVSLESYHPSIAFLDDTELSIPVDGFITKWPENATIILRRTSNYYPAMIAYNYGRGEVIVLTSYVDFEAEKGYTSYRKPYLSLFRSLLEWAVFKNSTWIDIPTASTPVERIVNITITNIADKRASKAILHWYGFSKYGGVKHYSRILYFNTSLEPGYSITIPVSLKLPYYGLWFVDYELLGEDNRTVLVDYFSEILAVYMLTSGVNNTVEVYGSPFKAWITSPSPVQLPGRKAQIELHLKNLIGKRISLRIQESVESNSYTVSLNPFEEKTFTIPVEPGYWHSFWIKSLDSSSAYRSTFLTYRVNSLWWNPQPRLIAELAREDGRSIVKGNISFYPYSFSLGRAINAFFKLDNILGTNVSIRVIDAVTGSLLAEHHEYVNLTSIGEQDAVLQHFVLSLNETPRTRLLVVEAVLEIIDNRTLWLPSASLITYKVSRLLASIPLIAVFASRDVISTQVGDSIILPINVKKLEEPSTVYLYSQSLGIEKAVNLTSRGLIEVPIDIPRNKSIRPGTHSIKLLVPLKTASALYTNITMDSAVVDIVWSPIRLGVKEFSYTPANDILSATILVANPSGTYENVSIEVLVNNHRVYSSVIELEPNSLREIKLSENISSYVYTGLNLVYIIARGEYSAAKTAKYIIAARGTKLFLRLNKLLYRLGEPIEFSLGFNSTRPVSNPKLSIALYKKMPGEGLTLNYTIANFSSSFEGDVLVLYTSDFSFTSLNRTGGYSLSYLVGHNITSNLQIPLLAESDFLIDSTDDYTGETIYWPPQWMAQASMLVKRMGSTSYNAFIRNVPLSTFEDQSMDFYSLEIDTSKALLQHSWIWGLSLTLPTSQQILIPIYAPSTCSCIEEKGSSPAGAGTNHYRRHSPITNNTDDDHEGKVGVQPIIVPPIDDEQPSSKKCSCNPGRRVVGVRKVMVIVNTTETFSLATTLYLQLLSNGARIGISVENAPEDMVFSIAVPIPVLNSSIVVNGLEVHNEVELRLEDVNSISIKRKGLNLNIVFDAPRIFNDLPGYKLLKPTRVLVLGEKLYELIYDGNDTYNVLTYSPSHEPLGNDTRFIVLIWDNVTLEKGSQALFGYAIGFFKNIGENLKKVWSSSIHLEQNTSYSYSTEARTPAINESGSYVLRAELFSSAAPVPIAKVEEPIIVSSNPYRLLLNLDKEAYKYGDEAKLNVTIVSGGTDPYTLVVKSSSNGVLYSGSFVGNRSITVGVNATNTTLNAELIDNSSNYSIEKQVRIVAYNPSINISIDAPEKVGASPFNITVRIANRRPIDTTINLSLDNETREVVLGSYGSKEVVFTKSIVHDRIFNLSWSGDVKGYRLIEVDFAANLDVVFRARENYTIGEHGVEVHYKNTGHVFSKFNVTVEVNGKLYSTDVFSLEPGSSLVRVYNISIVEGLNTITVKWLNKSWECRTIGLATRPVINLTSLPSIIEASAGDNVTINIGLENLGDRSGVVRLRAYLPTVFDVSKDVIIPPNTAINASLEAQVAPDVVSRNTTITLDVNGTMYTIPFRIIGVDKLLKVSASIDRTVVLVNGTIRLRLNLTTLADSIRLKVVVGAPGYSNTSTITLERGSTILEYVIRPSTSGLLTYSIYHALTNRALYINATPLNVIEDEPVKLVVSKTRYRPGEVMSIGINVTANAVFKVFVYTTYFNYSWSGIINGPSFTILRVKLPEEDVGNYFRISYYYGIVGNDGIVENLTRPRHIIVGVDGLKLTLVRVEYNSTEVEPGESINATILFTSTKELEKAIIWIRVIDSHGLRVVDVEKNTSIREGLNNVSVVFTLPKWIHKGPLSVTIGVFGHLKNHSMVLLRAHQSVLYTVDTAEPPSIESVEVVNTTWDKVTIRVRTSENCSVGVSYHARGVAETFLRKRSIGLEHIIVVDRLKPNTTYVLTVYATSLSTGIKVEKEIVVRTKPKPLIVLPEVPAATNLSLNIGLVKPSSPITEINITLESGVKDFSLDIQSSAIPPPGVSSPSAIVYQYVEIMCSVNTSAVIEFSVEKNWIKANRIDPDSIILLHYEGGRWKPIGSIRVAEDEKYVYYKTASRTSFSLFAIAAKKTQPSQQPQQVIVGGELEPPALKEDNEALKVVLSSVLIASIGLVVFVLRKRRAIARQ